MSKIVAIEHLTLDGVIQGPARSDEDTRDGFDLGGWAVETASHPDVQSAVGARMGSGWSLLLGRITYEDLYGFWPNQPPNPMTDALNRVEKFVVSTTAHDLPWQNSTLLTGDAMDAIVKLKQKHDKTLVIFGSATLVLSLMRHNLVDEFVLAVHPLVLGRGRRLFPEDTTQTNLHLVDNVTIANGVIVAIYQPVTGPEPASRTGQ